MAPDIATDLRAATLARLTLKAVLLERMLTKDSTHHYIVHNLMTTLGKALWELVCRDHLDCQVQFTVTPSLFAFDLQEAFMEFCCSCWAKHPSA